MSVPTVVSPLVHRVDERISWAESKAEWSAHVPAVGTKVHKRTGTEGTSGVVVARFSDTKADEVTVIRWYYHEARRFEFEALATWRVGYLIYRSLPEATRSGDGYALRVGASR